MRLPADDRSAWLIDAPRHQQDQADDHAGSAVRKTTRPVERVAAQLDRRRAAAARLPRLGDGRADPHSPLGHREPATQRELDSWACALAHLQSVGLAGLPPTPIRRALAARPERYSSVLPHRPAA